MKINKEIENILKTNKIDVGLGISYLLTLHFGYPLTHFSETLKEKMATTRIVTYNSQTNTFDWSIPLFEGTTSSGAFEWVITEYCELFKEIGKNGYPKECVARMKKLFSENPEIRKDEILGAARMYLMNTDAKYVQFPHYFIKKGSGYNTVSNLLEWVTKYQISNNQNTEDRDDFNTLQ